MMRFPEQGRIRTGAYATNPGDTFGAWFITSPDRHERAPLKIIANSASDESAGWEHVSVSLPHRCPTWPEMSFIKDTFWSTDDTVLQFHPPHTQYVNNHPYCLHLWRNPSVPVALPPSLLVGFKDLGVLR